MPSGVIVKGIGGFYYVSTPEGVFECKPRGLFRKKGITPLPGDKVHISISDEIEKIGSIDNIEPRSTELIRPAVTNIDQVVIIVSVKSPEPDMMLLDKLLITAEQKGIKPLICINKIDLDKEEEHKKILNAYSKTGYEMILASFKSDKGYDVFKNILKGWTTVFAGQSGVGKSTILNKIMKSVVMETGELSEKIKRGKHTTRHAELIELIWGGYIVDTPGFSSFELADIAYNELQFYYPEFDEFLNTCKFTGCSHISEPGCSVKDALKKGNVDKGRYDRYIGLYNTLKSINENRFR